MPLSDRYPDVISIVSRNPSIDTLKAERAQAEELVASARRQLASSGADNARLQQSLRHDLDEALSLVKVAHTRRPQTEAPGRCLTRTCICPAAVMQAKDQVIEKQDTSLADLRGLLAKEQERCVVVVVCLLHNALPPSPMISRRCRVHVCTAGPRWKSPSTAFRAS